MVLPLNAAVVFPLEQEHYAMKKFRVGDKIIYHKPKSSFRPSPRAREIFPLEHGEAYHYVVDKYWTVSKINDDGSIEVNTRTGKINRLSAADPNISRINPLQHLLYRKRFLPRKKQ